MAHIPENVQETEHSLAMARAGLNRFHQGKVRDSWRVPGLDKAFIVVATDRISIFDFVLPCIVSQKGEVLTALTYFWLAKQMKDLPNHLKRSARCPGYNYVHDLHSNYPCIPMWRALVVNETHRPNMEIIERHHIGGSVYAQYSETGRVWDCELPAGLPKWSGLDKPIFTPSTKADVGHDVNISPVEYYRLSGDKGRSAEELIRSGYVRGYQYAKERGVLILDMKGEAEVPLDPAVGLDPIIVDEYLTPDSSRFTTVEDYEAAMSEGRDPNFHDKELVRIWGRGLKTPWGIGLHKLDPTNLDHLTFVDGLEVPMEIIGETRRRYLDIFERLTGTDLGEFQAEVLGICDRCGADRPAM